MRVIITRTSLWGGEQQPCDGCTRVLMPYWDRRAFRTEAEHDAALGHFPGGKWRSRGSEHRITARGIERRLEDLAVWVRDFDTLEDLMEFAREHGDLVIHEPHGLPAGTVGIEIYDGYRE